MISSRLQAVIITAIIIYFIVLFYLLKKKSLSLKYTLLWFFSGFILLLIAIFPQVLVLFTETAGIQLPTNALFAVLIFCIIIILISLTSIVSKQTERIRKLAQSVAILEKQIRESERKV